MTWLAWFEEDEEEEFETGEDLPDPPRMDLNLSLRPPPPPGGPLVGGEGGRLKVEVRSTAMENGWGGRGE